MKVLLGALILSFGCGRLYAQGSDPAKVAAYLKTLPPAPTMTYGEAERETLASSGISCADHPQEAPSNKNQYLWLYGKSPELLDGYDRNRAFFGCGTWHDAVASTWSLVSLLKQDSKVSLASDIKDIATTHFRKSNVDGEIAFFTKDSATVAGASAPPSEGGPAAFERPYGYAWLLKLYGETKAWNNSDGRKLAVAMAPLARWMSERLIFYYYDLKFPQRTGVETNTAWSMSLAYDGALLGENETLKSAIRDNAMRLFSKDKSCPANFEPQNNDLISSCLSEAALMGRVMDQAAYLKWLDAYLPPVYSDLFQGYAQDIDISHTDTTGPDRYVQEAARAHLIALNFQRATELLTISYALPKDDARVAVLRRLAELDAKHGYDKISIAGYEGQHLIDVDAVLYQNELKGPAPLAPPPKPKKPADQASADPDTP